MVRNYKITSVNNSLVDEINRVMLECANHGVYINQNEASLIISYKSRKGTLSLNEIKNIILSNRRGK